MLSEWQGQEMNPGPRLPRLITSRLVDVRNLLFEQIAIEFRFTYALSWRRLLGMSPKVFPRDAEAEEGGEEKDKAPAWCLKCRAAGRVREGGVPLNTGKNS